MPVIRPFDMPLPDDVVGLVHLFETAMFRLYVVGGAVRDVVMGRVPDDYDLATDATPDQVLRLLDGHPGWRTDAVGRAFGVVLARSATSDYEVATFRQDVGAGRRPDSVVFTSIEEDVKRRDLTINALYYDVVHHELVDHVGGLADIDARVVRTVGNPADRFAEDRLRVLRAVRFASRLGYAIDPDTQAAILAADLTGVSPERIRDEFVRTLATAQSVPDALQLVSDLGLWRHVVPGVRVAQGRLRQSCSRSIPVTLALMADDDPWTRLFHALKYTADEINQTRVLLAFRDLEKTQACRLRKAFKASHLTVEVLIDYYDQRGLPTWPLVAAFIKYVDTEPVSGDALLAEGFGGRALGEELERREAEVFGGLI